jgi:predicted component of type VI protein secretion system
MKNRHRVVWSKGMFLNPQHFQAQDQYVEDTLHLTGG